MFELFLMDYLSPTIGPIFHPLHGPTIGPALASFLLYNVQLLSAGDLVVSTKFLVFSVRQELIVEPTNLEPDLDFDFCPTFDTIDDPNQLRY